MRFAERLSRLGTETAFEVMARAQALEAQGKRVVHLEIGEPDFDTPRFIRKAAAEALEAGFTHYGPSAGLPEFRRLIAEQWSRDRGIPCDADHVVVTPGAKPIMFFAMLALLEEGDEVLYPNPGFPIYESVANFLNARAIPLVLREENGFDLDIRDLERRITSRTRLLVLNSPHNPTGAVLKPETVEAIAALARKHDFHILSDEIYAKTQYEGRHVSIAALPGMAERTIVLDGFSKTYAMTGWRLGFGIMDKPLAKHVARLMTNSNSCTATFVQKAGHAALAGSQAEVLAMVEEFRVRRAVIVDGLNALPGVSCTMPRGAFYAFPNITGTGLKSAELAKLMLEAHDPAMLARAVSFAACREGGDLVVVELKRDKTPREITAQVLDYASWVKDLSSEQIKETADAYLGSTGPLEEAFRRHFGAELPDTLNEDHAMLVVGSEIDDGTVVLSAYNALLQAINSGRPADFDAIPLGGTTGLTNPQAGLAFDLEGPDAHALIQPPAPAFASRVQAAEISENYWMALLRDVPYSQYAANPIANAAAADLTLYGADFNAPKTGGAVTTATLFRGLTPGDLAGPYLSQFFYQDCNFGANKLEQKITTTVPGVDYMTDFATWLAVQRGIAQPSNTFDPVPRYMRNGRDIGQWVHIDVLFQGYFHAFLVLAGAGAPRAPIATGSS